MQTQLLRLSDQTEDVLKDLEIKLSFKPFINYLQKRVDEEGTVKKEIYKYVLQKFNSIDTLQEVVRIEETEKYKDELALAYSMLVPIITDEQEYLWAMSLPLRPTIFYGTDAFYSLMDDAFEDSCQKFVFMENWEEMNAIKMQAVYSLILEKLYGFTKFEKNEMIHSLRDEVSGLPRYFRITIDTRFVEIYSKTPLPPVLDVKELQEQFKEGFDWLKLSELFPLSNFGIEGFSVITVMDITALHAIENLKGLLLNRASYDEQSFFEEFTQGLKVLVQDPRIEFGVTPMLRLNGKMIVDAESCASSFLIRTAIEHKLGESDYLKWTENYYRDPKIIFHKNLDELTGEKMIFYPTIKGEGVSSYAVLPIFYHKKFTGVLEVYSKSPGALTESTISRLEPATALVAQLLESNINEFESKIDSIIKEKFTPLQPAVQWKFNEAAFHYLRDTANGQKTSIDKVLFKNVYPLYGAIDIRNSTVERNKALASDLKTQLQILGKTLLKLNDKLQISIIDELIFKCRKWGESLEEQSSTPDHNPVIYFLKHEVHPVLQHFMDNEPGHSDVINSYYAAINEETGEAFSNRRALEASMQTINTAISQYLELMRNEVRQTYPCYFEKFRTDGIEYDIYIGQSIVPDKKFNPLYLKNIRLQQLASMAAIAKITNSLLPLLEKPLLTTQLIFIHSSDIDISFRNDERRFDVEGSYNIRYHIVKKRIDKAHIKGTNERLTQPGKIALVYSSDEEANEYLGYIAYLHEQGIVEKTPEFLELEDLQGVTGLHALRLGVNYDPLPAN
jgi:hypothetical protein